MSTLVFSQQHDPWKNLALEQYLLSQGSEEALLYLWQNQNTVVIGRNQNAYAECDLSAMAADGITLARRSSGGGAVFHDLGNLNFTFVMPNSLYDVPRQMAVIQKGLATLGLETQLTGRNDIVVASNDCKFSGNAFQQEKKYSLHHGTVLVSADLSKAARYLTPSKSKLRSKGIKSVRSRICNLNEFAPCLTVEDVRQALMAAFQAEYGPAILCPVAWEEPELLRFCQRFSDTDWRLGQCRAYTVAYEARFPWGSIDLRLSVREERVTDAQVFSDAMDEKLITSIGPALTGGPYDAEGLAARLRSLPGSQAQQLAQWAEAGFPGEPEE